MSIHLPKSAKTVVTLATILNGSLFLSSSLWADDTPDLQVFENAVDIPDTELAEMRGRFVSPQGTMFFGVEMQSQWITRKGEVLEAGVDFTVDVSRNNAPNIQIRPTINIVQTGNPAQGSEPNSRLPQGDVPLKTIHGNGLDRTTGIGQLIQVTGDKNRIINDVRMNVVGARGGNRANDNLIAPNNASLPGTLSVASDTGAKATVTLENNALGVALTIPGEGDVRQAIQAGNLGSGVLQQAQVVTDLNRIHNTITINVGSNIIRDLSSMNAAAALQGLKDLQR